MTIINTSPVSIERRLSSRLIYSVPIQIKVQTPTFNQTEVLQITNVSLPGLCLVVSSHIPVNTELSLQMKLPHAYPCLNVTAKVLRSEKYSSLDGRNNEFICAFSIKLCESERKALECFIHDSIKNAGVIYDRRIHGRLKNALTIKNPKKFRTYSLSQDSYAQIQQLSLDDLDDLKRVEIGAWGKGMCATRAMLESRLKVFPEGMIGAKINGKICGYVCVIMINKKLLDKDFTWMEITDNGYARGMHNPNGDALYGVTLSVIPSVPKDVAVKLNKAAGKLAIRKGLKGIYFGCRIPNYHKYAKKISLEDYVAGTSNKGKILDPELLFYRQLNCLPLRVIPNYFKDPKSLNYGILVVWNNPFYSIQKEEYPFFIDEVMVNFT